MILPIDQLHCYFSYFDNHYLRHVYILLWCRDYIYIFGERTTIFQSDMLMF